MMDKKDYLNKVYRLAVLYGMCGSQREFAEILGVNRSGLSSAMNGSPTYLTDSLVAKVARFAKEHGIDEEAKIDDYQPEPPKRQIVIPEDTLELYTNLSETCRNLSSILLRMGVPVAPGVPDYGIKKDSLRDMEK